MSKVATKADSIPGVSEYKKDRRNRNRGVIQAKTMISELKQKSFDELTGQEKDDLLKAIALRFHMIQPD